MLLSLSLSLFLSLSLSLSRSLNFSFSLSLSRSFALSRSLSLFAFLFLLLSLSSVHSQSLWHSWFSSLLAKQDSSANSDQTRPPKKLLACRVSTPVPPFCLTNTTTAQEWRNHIVAEDACSKCKYCVSQKRNEANNKMQWYNI